MEEKASVTYFRHQTDYRALFLAYEQEVVKCGEWIERCDSLEQQLQLKDKMIELMAEEINKHNTNHTYFNNKNEEVNTVCFYKALAELEE